MKNKIIELALKLDKNLINLLRSDKKMSEIFFVEVGEVSYFDKDKFVRFVSNKEFCRILIPLLKIKLANKKLKNKLMPLIIYNNILTFLRM